MYMSNVYGIEGGSKSLLFEWSSGVFPESFKNHVVINIGRTEVYARTVYGTVFGWIGTAASATIAPGETRVLDNGNRPYYRVGLKVQNNSSNTRAVVCATYSDGSPTPGNDSDDINIDYNNIMKKLVVFGVKYIPYAGSSFSALLQAFWPENKTDVWDEIRDKVQDLIDKSQLEIINSILTGNIRQYQERIQVLESQLNPNKLKKLTMDTASYYMDLARNLVAFELNFTFPENKYIAFSVLPLYSAVIMMKMNYYAVGINKAQEIGLSEENVEEVKLVMKRLIENDNGVVKYLNEMYHQRLDDIYATRDVRDIYNAMMNTRSYIAVNGLEYIPLWKKILENPSTTETPYVDVVSYSEFHGRGTPNLYKEAIPEKLSEPLTPDLINGKRNRLSSVELHIWRIDNGNGSPKIGGLKVVFANGNNYMMGNTSSETIQVDFKGAFLNKLRVAGGNALDTFTFYFSDGREETYGTASNVETVYNLKDHHIASMFLASDDSKSLAGQAANFAVSYEQNY